MKRREWTDAALLALPRPASGRIEVRDSHVVGLVLRIMPSGKGSWSVRTRTADGKQTRPKLGAWPNMGIAAARKAARKVLGAVAAGGDPVAERREKRAARKALKADAKVEDRLQEWQSHCARRLQRAWSPRYIADVRRLAAVEIVPRLGASRLAGTTRADWLRLVAEKRKAAPAVAAGLYRVISSFLNHAEAEGWIPAPLLPRKGAARIAPPPPRRDRVLSDAELLAVWKAGDREPPKLRAFLRLLILTAARELEVADLAAGEVDLPAGLWRIPPERAKNRQAHVVPLSALVLAELAAVWPVGTEPEADHRLLGRSGAAGFRGFAKLKVRVDAASGVTGWRWHDLRRTARTGLSRLGVPPAHAEAALNHVSHRTALEQTYDRHDYGPEILAALRLWQAHVAAMVSAEGAQTPST